jgi:predicted membrane channel-forming protein YqfA (hemolysin III family)
MGFVLFAFGTVIVLPIAASVTSVCNSTNREWYWWVMLVLVVLSSLQAGYQLSRIRKKVDMENLNE